MLALVSVAFALEVSPAPLPAEPVVAWTQHTETGSEVWTATAQGEPTRVATHDGPLTAGPRLTRDIVLLQSTERRWWVDLSSGQVTPLPDGVTLAYADPERVVLWVAGGDVWQTTPESTPDLEALQAATAILGVLDGTLLLARGARIEAVSPDDRTPWRTLDEPLPKGTTGWMPAEEEWLVLTHPDGTRSGLHVETGHLTPDYGHPGSEAVPKADLQQHKRRLSVDRHTLVKGQTEDARWWGAPATGSWDAGFLDHLDVPASTCVEVPDLGELRCHAGVRRATYRTTLAEPVPGYVVDCPNGTWVSSRTASPPMLTHAEGWWCVDRSLRRRGPAVFQGDEGDVVVGEYNEDRPTGTWTRFAADGTMLEQR